jgi:hypothetical protein
MIQLSFCALIILTQKMRLHILGSRRSTFFSDPREDGTLQQTNVTTKGGHRYGQI